jgi:hypothetical protein
MTITINTVWNLVVEIVEKSVCTFVLVTVTLVVETDDNVDVLVCVIVLVMDVLDRLVDVTLINLVELTVELDVNVDVCDETLIDVDVLVSTEVEINCVVVNRSKVEVSRVVVDTIPTDRVEMSVDVDCKVTVAVVGDIVEMVVVVKVLVNDKLAVTWFVMVDVGEKVVNVVDIWVVDAVDVTLLVVTVVVDRLNVVVSVVDEANVEKDVELKILETVAALMMETSLTEVDTEVERKVVDEVTVRADTVVKVDAEHVIK